MTNAQLVPPHWTSTPDAPQEYALTATHIMRLITRKHVWRCPGCDHAIRLRPDQIEAVPFFIVRHLLRTHDIQPNRIIETEPALAGEVRDYCRQMGIRG